MLKSPEQILDEIKKWAEEAKKELNEYLSDKETDDKEKHFLLFLRERGDSQVPEKIKKVLTWIDEALSQDGIEGWKKFYAEWNGDPDISESKYNEDENLIGLLLDLRIYLERWEVASYQQKLQKLLQTLGINPDDEKADKKVEELRKLQDDLDDLEINKPDVKKVFETKETIIELLKASIGEQEDVIKHALGIESKVDLTEKEGWEEELITKAHSSEKLANLKEKLINSWPNLLDDEGKVNDDELAKIKANADKMERLITGNPDLITNDEIDQAKIDDFRNNIKNILGIEPASPLPDTWKSDLTTKLDEWEKRPTQEQLDEYETREKWLIVNNYLEENMWEEVKIEAKIELKEK